MTTLDGAEPVTRNEKLPLVSHVSVSICMTVVETLNIQIFVCFRQFLASVRTRAVASQTSASTLFVPFPSCAGERLKTGLVASPTAMLLVSHWTFKSWVDGWSRFRLKVNHCEFVTVRLFVAGE